MRLTRSICGSILLASAACSTGLTAPPNGLPVAISTVTNQDVQAPSITGGGDSVTAVVNGSRCAQMPTVDAGLRGTELVVTLSEPLIVDVCPAALILQLPEQIVVHDVPPGTRSARVVLRQLSGDKAKYSEIVSGTVTLP
jgi:hypothetical protein